MGILAVGSKQEQMRHVHMFAVAAESVVNALNLNAGVVVVVLVVVVVRMVAAKNENKIKNKTIFLFKQDKQELHSIMDLGWEDRNPSHHDRSKRAMFTTSGLATADA